MKSIKELLKYEHAGFSGVTHWLIAICLFFLMWLAPISLSQQYINAISANRLFAFLVFLIIGGASLLPDLDSSPLQQGGSTAVYQLGFLGQFLSLGCITISGVVWSVLHTKNDKKPPSQHRMLFHSPFIALMIFLINQFGYPDSDATAASLGLQNISAGVLTVIILGMMLSDYEASNFCEMSFVQVFCISP